MAALDAASRATTHRLRATPVDRATLALTTTGLQDRVLVPTRVVLRPARQGMGNRTQVWVEVAWLVSTVLDPPAAAMEAPRLTRAATAQGLVLVLETATTKLMIRQQSSLIGLRDDVMSYSGWPVLFIAV